MTDQLPKVICADCALKVNDIFEFHQKVLETENMFLELLKIVPKQEEISLNNVNIINEIHGNISRLTNGIDSIDYSNVTSHDNIHKIAVDLSVDDQVNSQEDLTRTEADIEVGDFQLDGETVRIVDEQMREVHSFLSNESVCVLFYFYNFYSY